MKRVLYILVLSSVFFCFNQNAHSQESIRGKVVDTEVNPIVGVNCVLYSLPDSTQVAGTTTDLDGFFEMKVKENKEYLLQISFVGYKTLNRVCLPGNLGEMVLNENTLLLDEVVVTPQILSTFGNKDQLMLSGSARKVGNNALDAIGSLPQFKTNASSGDLVTVDNKSILVLIDGMRRPTRDLMLLKAEDIKKILFYSDPPARYAHENIGAVIDVTTRKRTDRLYSLYLDTKNGITTGYGTDMLSMAYMDSLNMFTAAYFIDYRALNKNRMNNTYSYSDKMNEYRGVSGDYKGRYHIGQVAYQRYQGRNLFNAKVEYRNSPGRQEYSQKLIGSGGSSLANARRLESEYSSVSADLYYAHQFNGNRSVSFNVLNTYYKSDSDNMLSSDVGGYSFNNHIDNESYSLIAEALFSDKVWNGDFNFGAYYQYKNLGQTYNFIEKSTVGTHKEYVYADYSNSVGIFSYNVGLGLENNLYLTAADETYNYLVFRPSLALNLQYSKRSAMRLTASINSSVPNIGDLTSSIVTIDERFYAQGNTDLKPYYYYYANLSYKYASDDGELYLAPSVLYSYYPDKNMPTLFAEGGNIIKRTASVNDVHSLQASISLSYKPMKWLAFQPFYNYEHLKYSTQNRLVNHNLHNVGISVQLLPENWQIIWNANLPMILVNGDIYTRTGFNTTASVLYKFKSMSVGLEYVHNPNPTKSYADINGFRYSEETKWGNLKNLISVKFTYYLHKGKSRGHAGKRIRNSDNDSGLTDSNTAK